MPTKHPFIVNPMRDKPTGGETMSETLSRIGLKFQSGNTIPVERATIKAHEWKEILDSYAALEAERDTLRVQVKGLREGLEILAEPTNWMSEAYYTYETGSVDVSGHPQEREGRVELGVDIVWCGETNRLPKEIAQTALAAPQEQGDAPKAA